MYLTKDPVAYDTARYYAEQEAAELRQERIEKQLKKSRIYVRERISAEDIQEAITTTKDSAAVGTLEYAVQGRHLEKIGEAVMAMVEEFLEGDALRHAERVVDAELYQ